MKLESGWWQEKHEPGGIFQRQTLTRTTWGQLDRVWRMSVRAQVLNSEEGGQALP